jgi:hypothetical protein
MDGYFKFRTCKECKEEKPLTLEFWQQRNDLLPKVVFRWQCRVCRSKQRRSYYDNNLKYHNDYSKEYYIANCDKIKEWYKQYVIDNKDKISDVDDEEFKKCWALENLRPLSAKQNICDGNRR